MTYLEAQERYKKQYNKAVKTCWIADVLRSHKLTKHKAWNRIGSNPKYPCHDNIRPRLEKILQELEMIPNTCDECMHPKLMHRIPQTEGERTCFG
ncbi:MAG: hypothetical protein HZA82_06590, partial [Thaumarchaeota archaeon]|nr:hypothetical protein [Nitrososphaerota archaeon]